jgi:hypothetical protein
MLAPAQTSVPLFGLEELRAHEEFWPAPGCRLHARVRAAVIDEPHSS